MNISKKQSIDYTAILFVLKIYFALILSIDFLYFFFKNILGRIVIIDTLIIELLILYSALSAFIYCIFSLRDEKILVNISRSAKKIFTNKNTFSYPLYGFWIVMIPCSIIVKVSFLFYTKIIDNMVVSKWEILALTFFPLLSLPYVSNKIWGPRRFKWI